MGGYDEELGGRRDVTVERVFDKVHKVGVGDEVFV